LIASAMIVDPCRYVVWAAPGAGHLVAGACTPRFQRRRKASGTGKTGEFYGNATCVAQVGIGIRRSSLLWRIPP
jgi:hypothetical protein